MKKCMGILCLLLWTHLGFSQINPIVPLGCSINAGGDRDICFDDDAFQLQCVSEDVVNVQWIDDPNDQFLFSDVNACNPTITSASGGNFQLGVYTFTITGTCVETSQTISAQVQITVEGPINRPDITFNGNSVDQILVCNEVTLEGTSPGADTAFWILSNPANITETYSNDNSEATFEISTSTSDLCRTIFAYYTVSNGGCEAVDTVEITFQRTNPIVNIFSFEGLQNGGNVCANRLTFSGSQGGCNSTHCFSFTEFPGTTAPAIPDSCGRSVSINFTEGGWYTLQYEVTANPPCTGGIDTLRFFLCPTNTQDPRNSQVFLYCGNFPDTIELRSPIEDTLNCQLSPWTVISPFNVDVDIIYPDSNDLSFAQAIITNQNFSTYQFRQVATCDTCSIGGETVICQTIQNLVHRRGPTVEVDADTVNFSCGRQALFNPWSVANITGASNGRFSQVIRVPSGSDIDTTQIFNNTVSFNISDNGTYIFKMWISFSANGVTCIDTTEMVVNVCERENPSAGTTTNFTICDTIGLAGSLPLEDCSQPFWRQIGGNMEVEFIGANTINNPRIHVPVSGVYLLEYSYSRADDCYLADTLRIVVNEEQCDPVEPCSEITRLECVVGDNAQKCYEFNIRFCEISTGFPCFEDVLSSTGTLQNVEIVLAPITEPLGTYFISGVFKPNPGEDEFCVDVIYNDCVFTTGGTVNDTLSLCQELPECPCVVSNENVNLNVSCVSPQQTFCLDYTFDYCGQENVPITWSVDGSDYTLISATNGTDDLVKEGSNTWTLCFQLNTSCTIFTSTPLSFSGAIGQTGCTLEYSSILRCCGCTDVSYELEITSCTFANNESVYDFSITAFNVGAGGIPFTVTTSVGSTSSISSTLINNDSDLLITGQLRINGAAPLEACFNVDFSSSIYCDIVNACVELPPCCEEVKTKRPVIECAADEQGIFYTFRFEVGNADNRAFPFSITNNCGDVTFNPITVNPVNGNYVVSGTLRNLQVEPGRRCCFFLDFQDPGLCDDRVCMRIPECECYDNLSVDAPECVDSAGQQLCLTYNFDYFGPPTTGVSIIWYPISGTSSSITLASATNNTPGLSGNEVRAGSNTWELCFDYNPDGGECTEDVSIEVRAVMFTSAGLECCSFTDLVELECCCVEPEIIFEWCGLDDNQFDLISNTIDSQNPTLLSSINQWRGCGNTGSSETHSQSLQTGLFAENDSCCYICEDNVGPIFALDANTQMIFPNPPYTYQWSASEFGPLDQPYIIGAAGTTYTVTVTDGNNCSAVASITVDCESTLGGEERQSLEEVQAVLQEDLLVYPNPANDFLNLSSKGLQPGLRVQVIDLTGRQLLQQEVTEEGYMRLNTTPITAGTYFLQLRDESGYLLTSKRVIIMK
ncbi:MAG: T9SS type A sorting domain-containing protein [Bacteroidota bacterium]